MYIYIQNLGQVLAYFLFLGCLDNDGVCVHVYKI